MNSKLATETVHLLPILASLLFGVLCAWLIESSPLDLYPVTPFSEETYGFFGSFGNAFYFVILVGAGATILYLLLKRKSHKLIAIVTGIALTAAIFMLSMIYAYTMLSRFNVSYADELIIAMSTLATIITDYTIFKDKSSFAHIAVLCIGGALGSFLGFSIPTISAVLILVFLAVYDTFAVYRGPVGKIARVGLDHFRGLSFTFKDIQMGLGDLTFYSMLSGHMLLYLGLAPCLISMVGILAGCALSFKLLEKKGMFPGLPFPILLGLSGGMLAWLLFP